MKRAIVAGALVAALAFPSIAPAATPTERRLQRQITALQRDVRTLKNQVRQLNQGFNAALAFSVCSTAISADAFQGTWAILDQKPGGTAVGPQQAVNDSGACQDLGVARGSGVANLIAHHALLRLISFHSLF